MALCFRKDLVATTADDQGVACVEVTDPHSKTSFRFYDFEYALAQQLTGQPVEAVVAWASSTYGIDLTPDALKEFLEKLEGLGFLTDADPGAQPAILAPYAPSPGSFSFGDVATTVGGEEISPLDAQATADLFGEGPLAQGEGASGQRFARGMESLKVAKEPAALFPRLEVLAGPLPPVTTGGGVAAEASPGETVAGAGAVGPVTDSLLNASGTANMGRTLNAPAPPPAFKVRAPGAAFTAPAETPLGSIARAIAESTAPPPAGAIDIGSGTGTTAPNTSGGEGTGPTGGLTVAAAPGNQPASDTSSDASSDTSWVSDLAREVESEAHGDRRQPPPPEVVVMPPMADPAPAAPSPRRGRFALLVVLVIGGALAGAVLFLRPTPGGPSPPVSSSETAPKVHAISPQPTTFYGWFTAVGVVVPGQDQTFAFRAGGRLQAAMPAGTTFAAGEVVARLQGAAERELVVNRLRSRIAYFEQLRDSSRAEGAEAAARQAEAKLDARKQDLATAQAAQAELEIRPKVAGTIAEVLSPKGALVKAGAVLVRIRSATPRATFGFSADDVARARALNFCRIESLPGTATPDTGGGGAGGGAADQTRAIDCALPAASAAGQPTESRFAIDLVGTAGLAVGTEVRLASARYDGVFPVPRAAVVHEGDVDHVWIVSGGGRFAERRTVELAATIDAQALVAHGIAVGDVVVADPPATLKAGSEIDVVH